MASFSRDFNSRTSDRLTTNTSLDFIVFTASIIIQHKISVSHTVTLITHVSWTPLPQNTLPLMRYKAVCLGICPLLELILNPSDYIWSNYDVPEVTDYHVMVLLCIIPRGYRTGQHFWRSTMEDRRVRTFSNMTASQPVPPPPSPNNNTMVDIRKERRFLTRGLIWELTVSPYLRKHNWKLQLVFII